MFRLAEEAGQMSEVAAQIGLPYFMRVLVWSALKMLNIGTLVVGGKRIPRLALKTMMSLKLVEDAERMLE
ncbi:hypothetical protein COCHEDRAFT_1023408 [Bipolaris maydis C5]|uniref:Uncharacterized protein n=1 Tax=Cochliobolus heterostrophus (strain C5 / ATCC 48332 / race O) TaxID=701091 RepID=M2TP05_COCH5|nr:hypothetical protein COCHEDRAFT_1023408 [Bipolaris maydis C5]